MGAEYYLAIFVALLLVVFCPEKWLNKISRSKNPPRRRMEMVEKHRGLNGGKNPKKIIAINVPPDYFDHLVLIGPCARIDYQSMKEGKETEYRHKFGEETGKLPNAYSTLDGKCIVILGGNFSIEKGEDGHAWIYD